MPSNLTDSDVYEANVVGPVDGDAVNAASVRDGLQDLANRTTNIRKGVPGVAASYRYPLPLVPVFKSRFVDASSGGGTVWQQNDVTDQGSFVVVLPLPLIGTLTEVHVYVEGGAGHAGLPANKPDITLRKTSWTLGGATFTGSTPGSTIDGSATVGAYETVHPISITGLSETLSDLSDFWLAIRGESNANALVDQFSILKAYAVITP